MSGTGWTKQLAEPRSEQLHGKRQHAFCLISHFIGQAKNASSRTFNDKTAVKNESHVFFPECRAETFSTVKLTGVVSTGNNGNDKTATTIFFQENANGHGTDSSILSERFFMKKAVSSL